ncbi:MAG: hypothetical protein KGL37_10750, partial [Acidobacteriota bacterium]|nr:hypothetical protein [Acidobacteriota bacterium]
KRFPFRYDPLYWGAVFPVGMYAVATHTMSDALNFEFLDPLARLFSYAAVAAWSVTFLAFLWTSGAVLKSLPNFDGCEGTDRTKNDDGFYHK